MKYRRVFKDLDVYPFYEKDPATTIVSQPSQMTDEKKLQFYQALIDDVISRYQKDDTGHKQITDLVKLIWVVYGVFIQIGVPNTAAEKFFKVMRLSNPEGLKINYNEVQQVEQHVAYMHRLSSEFKTTYVLHRQVEALQNLLSIAILRLDEFHISYEQVLDIFDVLTRTYLTDVQADGFIHRDTETFKCIKPADGRYIDPYISVKEYLDTGAVSKL